MSLINDMLRDLDERNSGDGGRAVNTQQLASEIATSGEGAGGARADLSGIKPAKKSPPRWLASVFIIAMAGTVGWYLKDNVNSASLEKTRGVASIEPNEVRVDRVANIDTSTAVDPRANPALEEALENEGSIDKTVLPEAAQIEQSAAQVTTSVLEPVPEKLNADVIAALTLAEDRFARLRLTRPEHDSAQYYYRAALAVEPDNRRALAGLEKIAGYYSDSLRDAAKTDDAKKLAIQLQRAQRAGVDAATLEEYKQQLTLLEDVQAKEINHQPQFADASEQQIPLVEPYASEAKDSTRLHIEQTDVTQDRSAASQAKVLLKRGETVAAEALLRKLIEQQPNAQESNLALFDLLIAQNRIQESERLTASLSSDRFLSSYLNARLWERERKPLLAIDALASLTLDQLKVMMNNGGLSVELFERHQSLLAAIYQQTAQHLLAVEKYQMLLQNNSRNSAYWLGYAVSSDALQHSHNALKAFEMVANSRTLSDVVVDYARQRVASLKPIVAAKTNDLVLEH